VAIRWCSDDRLGADIAAGTRSIFDNEWLAQPLGKPLSQQARENVIWSAGGKGNDPAHWLCRIRLRPSAPRRRRQSNSARGQMQKLSAAKFHGVLHA